MEPQPSTGSSACERRFMFIFLIASLIGCCDIIEQILHHREQLQVHLERITVVNEESLQQTSTVENISGSVDVSTGQFRRKTSQAFVDDDWKYHPVNRYLQEVEEDYNDDDDNQNDNTEDDDNNNDDQEGKNNDDDCIRERTYLAELINHMISNPPEEWSTTEIILGCCLASVALSSVIVALCCVYGCCSAYCCCCCEGKGRKGKQSSTWDGDTAASQYGSDYQFTNDGSLV